MIWNLQMSLTFDRFMMTSSNKNIFRVTGLMCGEFAAPVTGEFPAHRPVTRSFDVFCDLRLNKRFSKQTWGWWLETPSGPLWRHCNVYCQPTRWIFKRYKSLINEFLGPISIQRCCFTIIWNPIVNIRLSNDGLIFITSIPYLERRSLCWDGVLIDVMGLEIRYHIDVLVLHCFSNGDIRLLHQATLIVYIIIIIYIYIYMILNCIPKEVTSTYRIVSSP